MSPIFQTGLWVDGEDVDATNLRLQLRSDTRSQEGVIEADDLRVEELAVPGTSVRVRPGACVVLGSEVQWQGSYRGQNIGDHELPIAATDASGGRSDLIVARAEDPTIQGSRWTQDPATGIVFPRVIANVDPSTEEVPAGDSAIALARIDIPASTGTITQDMITSLRKLMDPRRQQIQRIVNLGSEVAGDVLTRTSWPTGTGQASAWPNGAYWELSKQLIPKWARLCQIIGWIDGVQVQGSDGQAVWGKMRIQHGMMYILGIQYNKTVGGSVDTASMIVAGDLPIPADHRGTYRDLSFQAYKGGGAADLVSGWGTVVAIQVTYYEAPREQGWAD